MTAQDRLIIFDTTLRDGEQAPGIALSPDEKVAIAHQLAKLRVDVIEAGFAASSPGDFEGRVSNFRRGRGPSHRNAGPHPPRRHRQSRRCNPPCRTCPHPRVHIDLADTYGKHAPDDARRSLQGQPSTVSPERAATWTTSSSRHRTPPGPTHSSSSISVGPRSTLARPR